MNSLYNRKLGRKTRDSFELSPFSQGSRHGLSHVAPTALDLCCLDIFAAADHMMRPERLCNGATIFARSALTVATACARKAARTSSTCPTKISFTPGDMFGP